MKRRLFLQKSLLTTGALGLVPGGFVFPGQAGNSYNPIPLFSPPAEGPLDQSLPLRYRQVHLDFHTSGQIPGIGIEFDPEEFASTLKKAYVNSVTCFGRCHHGYIYHETDLFPERVHPLTKRPHLLKEQIEACHKQNIRVPIYVTVQWDEYTSKEHPEWLMLDAEGKPFGNTTFQPGFYRRLCVLTPYRDFLKKYLSELFEKVPVDGLFLDIVGVFPNANEPSLKAMREKGLDAGDISVRRKFYEEVITEFKADLTSFIRKHDKKCTIFYNGGHIGPDIRKSMQSYSHLELESLPSGGWGYLHFPLTSRYARTLGPDVLGMTGKFHTSWGDFHSLKNKAALEFECFNMLALNSKCSVGDQLHPRGRLDSATYDLIGSVYKQVAEKEAWCEGAKAVNDIAVFSAEEFLDPDSPQYTRVPQQMMGVVRMLQEGQHQFDVIDSEADIEKYKLLILPDQIPVNDVLKSKLETFTKNGGALIASFKSGLLPDGNKFASPLFGLKLKGEAPFSPDFLPLDGTGIGKGLPETELVMYMKGMEVELDGAESLVDANVPYFNRTWEHFSSHRHTPSEGKKGYPAVTLKGNVIYFMHPIFTQYASSAPLWCKKIFLNAVDRLLPNPVLKMENAPSSLVATVNIQPGENRYVIHFLCYVPERRGSSFDVVEDVIPVFNLKTTLNLPQKIRRISTAPQGKNISFRQTGNGIGFTLPELIGHQMIEVVF
jgi:hypothetical protein